MIKVGNIISNGELVNHEKLEYINYYDGLTDDYDHTLPTLFVGWQMFKVNHVIQPETIIKKEYKKNLVYWEFSFEENKEGHVLGVEMFARNVPYYYFRHNFKYENIDPIFNQITSIDQIFISLPKRFDITYNYKNEIIYLLLNDQIYSININMFKYFNLDVDKLLDKTKELSDTYIEDTDASKYQKFYKIFPNFDDLKRYMVVFLSKP